MDVPTKHICLKTVQVESHLLQHLNEAESAEVEEKLLVCQRCGKIYSLVDMYVSEIRRVLSAGEDQSRQLSVDGV